MQIKKVIRIKNITTNIAIRKFLPIFLVFHFLFAHIVLPGSIICFENDGTVNLENISAEEVCCSAVTLNEDGGKYENPDDCNDVTISDDCSEEISFTNKKIKTSPDQVIVSLIASPTIKAEKLGASINAKTINSSPLNSYKTISLII